MRIRTIKPEFFRSDDIDALCVADRLLFIGLWLYVDDAGIGIDKEAAIAADLFAGDLARDPQECLMRVRNGLERLANAGLIDRYAVRKRHYLRVVAFATHQRINRPSESRRPLPTSENASLSEDSVRTHGALSEPSHFGTGEQGNRGTGEQGVLASQAQDARDARTRAREAATAEFDEFWREYPRKKDKRAAERAWKAAITRGVDPQHLITGARAYAKQCQDKDSRFIKYPATWINAGAYDDEPEPEPRTRSQQWLALSNPDGHDDVIDAEVVHESPKAIRR